MATLFGKRRAGPIPWKARQQSKKIGFDHTENPPRIDHNPNHRKPIINNNRCPYTSPSLPDTKINVPTVRLYAAEAHVKSFGVLLKLALIIWSGAIESESPA
jgi:hypothetical protein